MNDWMARGDTVKFIGIKHLRLLSITLGFRGSVETAIDATSLLKACIMEYGFEFQIWRIVKVIPHVTQT
jgi:hypothetical protein